MDKPSFHDIAAMPFPQSQSAMRQHYAPNWHRFQSDGEVARFRVEISYSIRSQERVFYDVEATSEDEAGSIAEDMFDKDRTIDPDAEFDDIIVRLGEKA